MSTSSSTDHPGQHVRAHVIPEGMSVTKAAETIGIGRSALSNFLNGNAGLSSEMAARLKAAFGADIDDLLRRQAEYDSARRNSGQAVSATTRTFVPPFLMATANDIEEWANTHESRNLLAVLLRILVNSTCSGRDHVDFPGHDDAQRPGWDGRVETSVGNPWVPHGISGWEFGTNRRVAKKANEDFRKRTAATDEAEQQRTAFVFVTPRRWHGKEEWVREARAKSKWGSVHVLDSSDLEQWMEQSIPAQAWFGGRRGLNLRGVKSLDQCWTEWCADCQPRFGKRIFADYISIYGKEVHEHLRDDTKGILRIVATSRQEGLAFLAALFSEPDENFRKLRDRMVVFTEPGPLSELAVGSPGFFPIIADRRVEKELAESGCTLRALVVEHRTAIQEETGITLNPLRQSEFGEALQAMGLDGDEVERLDGESGRTLTILRRRLAQSKAIRSPDWSSEEELARALAPMMLAGAWKTDQDADRYLMRELAGYDDFSQLETHFTRLLNLEDSPVWSVGGFRGVVSKVDSLYGVRAWISIDHIQRFLVVAELVLSERDPALDLPEDRQWAAAVYEKTREISSPLRKGVAESLVLLAIHGNALFGGRFELDMEHEISNLVCRVLEPLTVERLRSQHSHLPLYAEAAPEAFLKILERDLSRSQPVLAALMKPQGDFIFAQSERVGLLWALELLAWCPEWLDRVVAVLAKLAEIEPDDNLANKPSGSLGAIFRSWLPQTAAPLAHRIAAFDRLAEEHPNVAWNIATSQFEEGSSFGTYSQKPNWRDYAQGFGERISMDERRDFAIHCIEACLDWPLHTRETLADLMERIKVLRPNDLSRLRDVVAAWADRAQDQDRAWLRERIRVSTRRTLRRPSTAGATKQSPDERVLVAQEAFAMLEPKDPVWKHAWLFESTWVTESLDEFEEEIDYAAIENRMKKLRAEAVQEVNSKLGFPGLMQLAFSGKAPDAAGHSIAEAIEDQARRQDFLRAVLEDENILTSSRHQSLLRGFLQGMKCEAAIALAESFRLEVDQEVGVQLFCLAGFNRSVWSRIEEVGGAFSEGYWANVQPSWRGGTDEDISYAVSRLLDARRPLAAFNHAHLDWACIESGHIQRILSDLRQSEKWNQGQVRLKAHYIRKALSVLNERNALGRPERARLEFLYIDQFWLDEGGLPNLEQEIEANPEIFCEAITLAYPRENSDAEHAISEKERNAAQRAHRLLHKLSHIPGHDSKGDLDAHELTKWIQRAQQISDDRGRRHQTDYRIGELLASAATGEDGVWPCTPVRKAMEAVLNDDIASGFRIGRQNLRGVYWQGEGGAEERKLAEQYEKWASASDFSYPKVAAVLRDLASIYKKTGQWQDQQAAVQRRLGY